MIIIDNLLLSLQLCVNVSWFVQHFSPLTVIQHIVTMSQCRSQAIFLSLQNPDIFNGVFTELSGVTILL